MERLKHLGKDEFFEANQGRSILKVTQKLISATYRLTEQTQDLIVGSPEDVKLSARPYYTFNTWHLSDGQTIRERLQGYRLEKSVLHLSKTGQIVLIFDSDDLNFPYLAYLHSKGLLEKPFRFTQFDAHFDIDNVKVGSPRKKDFDSLLNYHREYVGIANFITAMATNDYLYDLVHVNPSKLMAFGGEPPELYQNIKKHEVSFKYISPYFGFLLNNLPKLFANEGPTVLALDIDFFGEMTSLSRGKKNIHEITKIYLDKIKEHGYSPEKCPVICIATSPGFNEGFREDADNEKLELVSQIIDELNLH